MNRLPSNLPALLREAGLTVVVVDGWLSRGRPTGGFEPVGTLNHHTGASARGWTRAKELAYAKWMFLTGRSDLPAPLCQIALGRSGTVYLGAAGRANHAGVAKASGSVGGGDGNRLYAGVEWMLSGTEEIPPVMMSAAITLNAVMSEKVTRTSVETVSCHYNTSVTGKWDIGDPKGVPFTDKRVLDIKEFRRDVAAERDRLYRKEPVVTEYHWYQPGKLGSPSSGCALGVRKDFGRLGNKVAVVGSPATSEGGGIRMRPILRGRVKGNNAHQGLAFSAAVGHAPPPRAPKARTKFMERFAKMRANYKGGDLNLGQRLAARATGRSVVGQGVLWLAVPRKNWTVVSVRSINVGGDHKAILVRMRHKKTGVIVRFLVINAMSVSASAKKSSGIFANGLALNPDVVMATECADFRAATVDARN